MLTLHVCFTLNYIFVPKYLSTCTVYTVYNIYVLCMHLQCTCTLYTKLRINTLIIHLIKMPQTLYPQIRCHKNQLSISKKLSLNELSEKVTWRSGRSTVLLDCNSSAISQELRVKDGSHSTNGTSLCEKPHCTRRYILRNSGSRTSRWLSPEWPIFITCSGKGKRHVYMMYYEIQFI